MKDTLFSINIAKLNIEKGYLQVELSVNVKATENNTEPPRMMSVFQTKNDSRVMPLPKINKDILLSNEKEEIIEYSFSYELSSLFWNDKNAREINLSFSCSFENKNYDNLSFICKNSSSDIIVKDKCITLMINKPLKQAGFFSVNFKEKKKRIIKSAFSILFLPFRLAAVKMNRITFLSNRTTNIEDNQKCVYDALKKYDKSEKLDIKVFCSANSSLSSISSILKFMWLYSTSRVVIVNDYYQYISLTPKKKNVKLIQLWHGGGAYKTIGFSRLGTETKLEQSSTNHRQYDVVIAGSKNVVDFYAEGFGVSTDKVKLTGIPRSDLFFNQEYSNRQRELFYKRYTEFRDKKIILFAPTFRGNGKSDCYYPYEKFDVKKVLDSAGDDYSLIIKLHPYLKHSFIIPEGYESRILDLTYDYNINDLLFITDVLITDYSSVVFESSLLRIPTLIYAFDIFEYIRKRDFYVDFYHSLPGKPVMSEEELYMALKDKDYQEERLNDFCKRYSELENGNSSDNVAKLILEYLK